MPRFQYTALPLATLTLTAHTRPVSPPPGPVAGRDGSRSDPDATDRGDSTPR